jgi:hypothetical protein
MKTRGKFKSKSNKIKIQCQINYKNNDSVRQTESFFWTINLLTIN